MKGNFSPALPCHFLTFQVSVDDAILVKEDNSVCDLSDVVTDHTLSKHTKVVQQLVQAATCMCDHMTIT